MGIMKHHETLGFQATSDIIAHEPEIKNFKSDYDALVERKSLTVSTPLMPSNLGAIKWAEALLDLLSRLVDEKTCL